MPKYQVNKRRVAPKGYQTLTRKGALAAYLADIPVTVCGNNVNSFHVFNGWHLGYTFQKSDIEARSDWTFDSLLVDWQFYLDRELGTYPVFYIEGAHNA